MQKEKLRWEFPILFLAVGFQNSFIAHDLFQTSFDERLLSADEKSTKNAVNFFSYNGFRSISFSGDISEINPNEVDQN